MQSFKTLYRLGVMGATLAIAVMAWRLYGPPAEQVKSVALQALERVEAWLAPEEKPAPLPLSTMPPLAAAPSIVPSPPPLAEKLQRDVALPESKRSQTANSQRETGPSAASPQSVGPTAANEQLRALLSPLLALGVQEPQLVAWGDRGQLFRCFCRDGWGRSPQFGRHFESVAAEPETAVKQVVAQVDAWRTSERAGK